MLLWSTMHTTKTSWLVSKTLFQFYFIFLTFSPLYQGLKPWTSSVKGPRNVISQMTSFFFLLRFHILIIFYLLTCLFTLFQQYHLYSWKTTRFSFPLLNTLVLVLIYRSLKRMKFSIKAQHFGKSPFFPSLTTGHIDLTPLRKVCRFGLPAWWDMIVMLQQ